MKKRTFKKLALAKETLRSLDEKRLLDAVGGESGKPTCYTSCMISQDSCQATCDTCFPC
jgi:hypothetical protein